MGFNKNNNWIGNLNKTIVGNTNRNKTENRNKDKYGDKINRKSEILGMEHQRSQALNQCKS